MERRSPDGARSLGAEVTPWETVPDGVITRDEVDSWLRGALKNHFLR